MHWLQVQEKVRKETEAAAGEKRRKWNWSSL